MCLDCDLWFDLSERAWRRGMSAILIVELVSLMAGCALYA